MTDFVRVNGDFMVGVPAIMADGSRGYLPVVAAFTADGVAGPSASQLPASLGIKAAAASLSITPASDASFTTVAAGNVAHDAADSGSPVKVGGYASDTAPAAVTAGDRVNARYSLAGSAYNILTNQAGAPIGTYSSLIDGVASPVSGSPGLSNVAFNLMWNGTSWDRARGDVNGIVIQPHALTGSRWQYAGVTGGITDTSDVALAAAGAAGVRNYVTGIQYHNTSGVPSEIVIKDGSTVIWRGIAPATMTFPATIHFPVPLKGTAATAMNVAMVTTATATVVSAQGYTGS